MRRYIKDEVADLKNFNPLIPSGMRRIDQIAESEDNFISIHSSQAG